MRQPAGQPRGVLKPPDTGGVFRHARYQPPPDLSFFLEHFWVVAWDLRGQAPVTREVLNHPCIHLLFETGRPGQVAGLERGRFTRTLAGEGQVFGVKFRPGGFRPFLDFSVSRLTGKIVPLNKIFGNPGAALAAQIQALDPGNDEARMLAAEAFLRARLPERDENVLRLTHLVELIMSDPSITRVSDLAAVSGLGVRTLQRLFGDYVGLAPKWMIQRYRLHEALERVSADRKVDWAHLALDLGYFDQAHFIKDFKALVGRTPAEYARIPG